MNFTFRVWGLSVVNEKRLYCYRSNWPWLSTLRAKKTLTKKVQTFIWDTALKTFHQDIVFQPQQPDMSCLFCLLFWFILARDDFCWQFDKSKLYTVILASYLGGGEATNSLWRSWWLILRFSRSVCKVRAVSLACFFFLILSLSAFIHAETSCKAKHAPYDVMEFNDLTGILSKSKPVHPGVYPFPGVDLLITLTSIPLSQMNKHTHS